MRRALANPREHADFFDWHKKEVKELHIAGTFLGSLLKSNGRDGWSVASQDPDPPDCVATTPSQARIAIEVTELVDGNTIKSSKRPGVTIPDEWTNDNLVAQLQHLLKKKDSPSRIHGGPYDEYWLVIHTDEPELPYERFLELMGERSFGALRLIDRAFVLFSYDPRVNGYPFMELYCQASE